MLIVIKTWDGRTFPIGPSSMRDVKMEIQNKINLHESQQNLFFQADIVDDDKSFEEHQIYDEDVVKVVPKLRDGMQVFAKTIDGKTIPFEVRQSDKVIDIKKVIQYKTGLHPDKQILICQDRILHVNNTPIDEYQICENSVINVVDQLSGIQIFVVPMDGRTVSFEVQMSDTILDIKYKIQKLTEMPPNTQQLSLGGEGLFVSLDNNKTVGDLNIVDKEVIRAKTLRNCQ